MLGDHLVFPIVLSTDLAASRAFYHDTLGLDIAREDDERIKVELADLRARGVPIQEYDAPDPKTVDGIADMGFAWAAWILDPSRNVLGIIQPKVVR
jgi:catechol 2,3-dioxygenase-like lactoylglutathione lyase family enzyme